MSENGNHLRQKELDNCGFVKTALMLVVVLYHSILFWNGSWFTENPVFQAHALGYIAKWLNSFHIYGFTLVSGYLFYYLKHEKGKYEHFVPFVINKAKRLIVPYVFASAIWVGPFQYIYLEDNWLSVISNLGLGTNPNQLWFLLMLFLVFVIAWLLSSFFEKHDIASFAVAITFYGISFIGPKLVSNIYQIWTACQYVIFFLLGFKIRQHGSAPLMKIPCAVWLVCDILLFLLTQFLSGYDSIVFKLLSTGASFVLHIFGSVMAFVILQKAAMKVPYQNSRGIKILTATSMTVYLFHQQVIYVLITLLNGVVNPYINAIINFSGAMILSLLIAALLMRSRITKFLIGEK